MDNDSLKEFEKKYNIDIDNLTFTNIFQDLITKIMAFQSKDIAYYEPLIKSSLLNFRIHPETIDWITSTYYKRNTIPTLEKLGIKKAVGETIANLAISEIPVNQDNVQKFKNKLTIKNKQRWQF